LKELSVLLESPAQPLLVKDSVAGARNGCTVLAQQRQSQHPPRQLSQCTHMPTKQMLLLVRDGFAKLMASFALPERLMVSQNLKSILQVFSAASVASFRVKCLEQLLPQTKGFAVKLMAPLHLNGLLALAMGMFAKARPKL